MSDSNDRAFIKVSEELIRRRNDLKMLESMALVGQGISSYARSQLGLYKTNGLHTDEFQGGSRIVELLLSSEALARETKKIKAKIEELDELAAIYVRGGDIVAAKLSK